ncbi:MAG: hypothetical protein WCI77_03820 [Candidatus Omnitrophota bacterium]
MAIERHLTKKYRFRHVGCARVLSFIVLLLFLHSTMQVYAVTIPAALEKLGFTEDDLLNYRRQDEQEFFTFSDKRTRERQDVITFVIENGEIIAYPNPMVEKKEDKRDSLDM